MQILFTHGRLARSRVLQIAGWQIALAVALGAAMLMMVSGATYHLVFLKAAREGWPVVAPLVRLIVRDEIEQRERFMRENLDALGAVREDAGGRRPGCGPGRCQGRGTGSAASAWRCGVGRNARSPKRIRWSVLALAGRPDTALPGSVA
jgi:hypothetical protein